MLLRENLIYTIWFYYFKKKKLCFFLWNYFRKWELRTSMEIC